MREIKTISQGRGRKLKSQLFPELVILLSYTFWELDARNIGGLEVHPRLTTGTMYRGNDYEKSL